MWSTQGYAVFGDPVSEGSEHGHTAVLILKVETPKWEKVGDRNHSVTPWTSGLCCPHHPPFVRLKSA